jgi:phage internal scaffolding protein
LKFATLYDEGMKPSEGIIFVEPSMTDQSNYQESDINYIVKKYADGRTGITTLDLGADAGVLQYGDTLLPGDYDTALDLINAVSDEFYQLPAQIRAEFNHNPKELINALADPRQRDRLFSLGLLRQDTVVPSSAGDSQNEDNGTSSKKQNETQSNEST